MGGTVHGMVNKKIPVYANNNHKNGAAVFACIAQFFDHLCTVGGGNIMTRVASNYGGGTGFDYPGGANPIGYNLTMGLWKMNTSTLRPGGGSALGEVYIFMVTTDQSSSSQYISYWGLRMNNGEQYGGSRVGLQIVFREDGGDPWNSTENNDGLDVPGSPLWTAGGSTLHVVLPRSCNPGGAYDSGKNQLANLGGTGAWYEWTILDCYFHGVADDDNFVLFVTRESAATSEPLDYAACVFGLGDLQPNAEGPGADPYCCYAWIDSSLSFSRGSVYGDTTGASGDQGGLKTPRGQIAELQASVFTAGLDQYRAPNRYSTGALIYDELAVSLYNANGWIGYGHEPGGSDFWRLIYGVPNESLDATNERAAFCSTATLSEKITVPWPGTIGEAPGATRTYAGVTF
jgi:hypothetical protein